MSRCVPATLLLPSGLIGSVKVIEGPLEKVLAHTLQPWYFTGTLGLICYICTSL